MDIESNNNSFDDSDLTIDDDEMSTIENYYTDLYNNFNLNNNDNKSHGFIQQYLYKGDSNKNNNIKLDLKSNLINKILIPELKTQAMKIIICDDDCII